MDLLRFWAQRVGAALVMNLAMCCVAVPVAAQSGDEVLASNGKITLYRSDFEADLQRIPSEMRAQFLASPRRISEMLVSLLVAKTLAAEAREAGLDKNPAVQRRIDLEIDKTLASIRADQLDAAAAAEFEAKIDDFTARARELYLTERDKHVVPETVSASHILFRTDRRSKEEALKLASEARARALAGEDFAKLATELSEDPSANQNAGHLGYFARQRMDPAFATAAFAMSRPGEISEPVLSSFGYHIIRFEGRRPERVAEFDEVKTKLLEEEKRRYIENKRTAHVRAIHSDPNLKVNQPALDALRPQAGGNAPVK